MSWWADAVADSDADAAEERMCRWEDEQMSRWADADADINADANDDADAFVFVFFLLIFENLWRGELKGYLYQNLESGSEEGEAKKKIHSYQTI